MAGADCGQRAPGAENERRAPGSRKEAAPAGGESGGRAHGPALGGEAGSVLIEKLIRIGLPYRAQIFTRSSTLDAPMQRQPIELQHMCPARGQSLRVV